MRTGDGAQGPRCSSRPNVLSKGYTTRRITRKLAGEQPFAARRPARATAARQDDARDARLAQVRSRAAQQDRAAGLAAVGIGADAAWAGAGAAADVDRRRTRVEAAQHVVQIDRLVRQLVAARVGPEGIAEQRKRNVAGDVDDGRVPG